MTVCGNAARHTCYEPGGGRYCRLDPLQGHDRTWPRFIIGNSFQIVSLWQKAAQLGVKAWLVPRQEVKLAIHASMTVGDFAGALGDESLRAA